MVVVRWTCPLRGSDRDGQSIAEGGSNNDNRIHYYLVNKHKYYLVLNKYETEYIITDSPLVHRGVARILDKGVLISLSQMIEGAKRLIFSRAAPKFG